MKQVKKKVYEYGPDQGRFYLEVDLNLDKTHNLKIGKWKVPKNYGKLKLRDNPEDDVFNAFSFIEFYL